MTISQKEIDQEKKNLTFIYLLYTLGLFSFGITAIIGYFMAKKKQSSYYVNHYNRLVQIFNKSGIYFLVGIFTAGMGDNKLRYKLLEFIRVKENIVANKDYLYLLLDYYFEKKKFEYLVEVLSQPIIEMHSQVVKNRRK